MTNELGTTLDDIQAKAERQQKAMTALTNLYVSSRLKTELAHLHFEIARQYIEEN